MCALFKYIKCEKDKTGYHDMKQLREMSDNEWGKIVKYREYKCDFCYRRWVLKFDPWEQPVDRELYAQLFARDFLQPSHQDFERVYSKKQAEFVRSEHQKNKEGEDSQQEMRNNVQEFKGHYLKGRKYYGR